jgi:hypothetical protein
MMHIPDVHYIRCTAYPDEPVRDIGPHLEEALAKHEEPVHTYTHIHTQFTVTV